MSTNVNKGQVGGQSYVNVDFFSFLFKIVPILNMRTTMPEVKKNTMNVLLIYFRIDNNTYTSDLTAISTCLVIGVKLGATHQYRGKN